MVSITKQVPIEQVPKAWLDGVEGAEKAPVIQITLDIPPVEKPAKMSQEQLQSILARLREIGESIPKENIVSVRQMRDEREKELFSRIR